MGGLLVAVAAVGLFLAYTGATGSHVTTYVVAARNLESGHHVVAGDLGTAPMTLPASMADSVAFRDPARLIGTILVAPLRTGELVQVSDVVKAGSPGVPSRLMSFSIPSSLAVGGELAPGDLVDVLSTVGTGTQAQTSVVVRALPVVGVAGSAGGFGSSTDRTLVITVSMDRASDAVALAQAVNASKIILVRSTGANASDYATPPTGTNSGAPPGSVAVPGSALPAGTNSGAAPGSAAVPGSALPAGTKP